MTILKLFIEFFNDILNFKILNLTLIGWLIIFTIIIFVFQIFGVIGNLTKRVNGKTKNKGD